MFVVEELRGQGFGQFGFAHPCGPSEEERAWDVGGDPPVSFRPGRLESWNLGKWGAERLKNLFFENKKKKGSGPTI